METNVSKLTGIALATAVAGLFALSSPATAQANETTDGKVRCENSSACKGQGACGTAKNSCKGQNACKGAGMTLQDSQEACDAAQKAAKADDKKGDM